MERKELVVVLLLGLLVMVGATVRLFSTPLPMRSRRRTSTTFRPAGPRPAVGPAAPSRSFGAGAWRPRSDGFPPRDPGARNLFEAGEVAYGNGLFDPAIEIYQHFLKEHKDDPAAEMALLRIAQCHTLMKRHEEAAQHYDLFLERYPRAELRPLALLWSGNSHLFLGASEVARTRFAEVIAQFPHSPFAATAKVHLERLDTKPKEDRTPAPATRTP